MALAKNASDTGSLGPVVSIGRTGFASAGNLFNHFGLYGRTNFKTVKKQLDIILKVCGVAFLLLVAIGLFNRATSQENSIPPINLHLQKYKPFTSTKIWGYGLTAFGGAMDGLYNGFEFDNRKSFERKINADPNGPLGSESWRMIYNGGNPDNGVKSKFYEWVGALDFIHATDDFRKVGYVSGGVLIGLGGHKANKKKWHYFADYAIGWVISSTTKSLAMRWIRN